jgi:hypothetical protein
MDRAELAQVAATWLSQHRKAGSRPRVRGHEQHSPVPIRPGLPWRCYPITGRTLLGSTTEHETRMVGRFNHLGPHLVDLPSVWVVGDSAQSSTLDRCLCEEGPHSRGAVN